MCIFEYVKKELLKDKTTKVVKENLEEMREMNEKVESSIGLDFSTPKFQEFMDYIEKINDLQVLSYLNHKLNWIREEFMNVKTRIKSLKNKKMLFQVTLRQDF